MFPPSAIPPTAEEISAAFGFPAPEPFVKFLQFIHRETGENKEGYEGFFERVTALDLRNWTARYDTTPMELFPFGSPGVDGIHMGYVIHDERLGPDFPVGSFCPMDSEGVGFIGRDTLHGFDVLMSRQLKMLDADRVEQRAMIAKAAAALGISPSAEKDEGEAGWGFGLPKDGLGQVKTPLPEGWKLAMTADNLGVAAPVEFFAPDQDFDTVYDVSVGIDDDESQSQATAAEESGHFATALVHLRNLYWFGDGAPGMDEDRFAQMSRVYLALGRPLLADHLRRQFKGQ